jgi:ribosomal protein S18 acetylase RimI-like enzyme
LAAPSITIVRATPDHSPFLARIILASSRGHLRLGTFDVALDLPEDSLLDLLEWVNLSDFVSNCHFSKFLVAEREGEPLGALAAFDPTDSDLFPIGAALSDAFIGMGYSESDLNLALQRFEATRSCLPTYLPKTLAIEWIAVEAAHRGQGILPRLLTECFAIGVERSFQLAQISTYLDNRAAITAYERLGFYCGAELSDPAFEALLGSPGMAAMRRDLSGNAEPKPA